MVELQRSEAKTPVTMEQQKSDGRASECGNVKDDYGKDGRVMKMLNGERKKNNLQSLLMSCCYRFGSQQMLQFPGKQRRICQL